MNAGTRLTTATGTISVTGASSSTGMRSQGVLFDTATVETTGIGTLTFNGTTVGLDTDWGVGFQNGATVRTTAAGGGKVTLLGTGVQDGGIVIFNGHVLSGGGDIFMEGSSGAGDSINIGLGSTIGGVNAGNITLVAQGRFANVNTGSNPITTPGRWLLFSANPTNNTLGGIAADFKRYGCAYYAISGGCFMPGPSIPGTGNGLLYSYKPTLAIAANAASKVYGALDPAYTHVVTGLFNGDLANTPDVLSGALGRTIATGESVLGGPYAIDQGTLISPMGYGITYTPANLTITPAPLTVTANAATKTYGTATVFAGTEFTPAGLQFGETIGSVTLNSTGVAATSGVAGSPYAIIASAATGGTFVASNYTISYVNGALTITPAPLTITANSTSKVYGTPQTYLDTEFTTLGLANGENVGSVNLASSGDAATANVAGGPYAITASAANGGTFTTGNYTISYVNGALTITPLGVTIAANAATKVYGNADALTFTATGLMSWDTNTTAFTGALSHTNALTPVGEAASVTPYAITQGTLTSTNYTITGFTPNTLTITQAQLTVAANATSKILNTADPLLTYTVSGLQFTDTTATTLTGSLSRIAGETVGTYQINQGSLSLSLTGSGNYTMSYVPANFTILVPTVIDEIVNTSLMFGPDSGSARSTSSKDKEDKAKEEILAVEDTKPIDGKAGQPLPVCN